MAIVDFESGTWKDTWFRKLPIKAKCLFLFLWTNDHKNLPCLYQIDLETISFYTGLSLREIKDNLSVLNPKVQYDYEKEVVFVVNFVRHQFLRTSKLSPKIKTGVENNLLQMNGHFFINEFLKEYPMFSLPETYGIDRVLEGYTYPPSEGGGEGEGEGSFIPNIKKNELFEKFYQEYPNKKSKGQALKAWWKIKPTPNEQLVATMIATIERAKTSREWLKNNGEFIPYPATWLNAQGWLDEITIKQEDKDDWTKNVPEEYR